MFPHKLIESLPRVANYGGGGAKEAISPPPPSVDCEYTLDKTEY